MQYQIDQSGKIEQTQTHTVIAYANSSHDSVIIPAKEKRIVQEWFRLHGIPRLFVDITFACGLYILIKTITPNPKNIIVDIEYPGHTKIISMIIIYLTKGSVQLDWRYIGKEATAHDIAYKIYRKKMKAGKVIKAEDIIKYAEKIAGGYLNSGLSPENRYSAPANMKRIHHNRIKIKRK